MPFKKNNPGCPCCDCTVKELAASWWTVESGSWTIDSTAAYTYDSDAEITADLLPDDWQIFAANIKPEAGVPLLDRVDYEAYISVRTPAGDEIVLTITHANRSYVTTTETILLERVISGSRTTLFYQSGAGTSDYTGVGRNIYIVIDKANNQYWLRIDNESVVNWVCEIYDMDLPSDPVTLGIGTAEINSQKITVMSQYISYLRACLCAYLDGYTVTGTADGPLRMLGTLAGAASGTTWTYTNYMPGGTTETVTFNATWATTFNDDYELAWEADGTPQATTGCRWYANASFSESVSAYSSIEGNRTDVHYVAISLSLVVNYDKSDDETTLTLSVSVRVRAPFYRGLDMGGSPVYSYFELPGPYTMSFSATVSGELDVPVLPSTVLYPVGSPDTRIDWSGATFTVEAEAP